jgi:hypothetical protein
MMWSIQLWISTLALLLTLTIANTSYAEILILSSNVEGIVPQTRYPDGWQPRLGPGERVHVLLLPANKSKLFEHPGERPDISASTGGSRGVSQEK